MLRKRIKDYIPLILIGVILLSSLTILTEESHASGIPKVTKHLISGSRGTQVKYLQQKLKALGYNVGDIDSSFGPQTRKAVQAFQKDNNLEVDGSVGPATRSKLNSAKVDPKPNDDIPKVTKHLISGSRGTQVKYLQQKLKALGYNVGNIDSSFGPQTRKAVEDFQKDNNLEVDGSVGPATRAKLNSSKPGSKPDSNPEDDLEEFIPESGKLKGKTVILDAGHGGSDSGSSRNGVHEKDLTLDMALRLERMLKEAGANVIMTRKSDTYSHLFYRSAIVNKHIVDMEKNKLENSEQDSLDKKSELKTNLDDLNTKFKNTQEEIENKNKELDELKSINQQRDFHDNKSSKDKLLEEINNLEQDKRDKEDELEIINDEIDNEDSHEDDDEEIDNLKDDSEDKEIEINKLETEIAELDNEISDYQSEISSIESKINETDELELTIKELEDEIDKLEDEIDQIKISIKDVEEEIKLKDSNNSKINTDLADLKDKSNLLQEYINNPEHSSRTGIYDFSNSSTKRINGKLEEVFDITKELYEGDTIFVSIHINSTDTDTITTASGVQAYYRPNNSSIYTTYPNYYRNYNDNKRLKLTTSMLRNTSKNTNFKGNWSNPLVKDLSVLREQNLPSVLMEIGFINNPNDSKLLQEKQTRENAAKGMYYGIVEYFQ